MVSTVWSVSCLLFFYSRCPPPCPAICKRVGGGTCPPWPMDSAPVGTFDLCGWTIIGGCRFVAPRRDWVLSGSSWNRFWLDDRGSTLCWSCWVLDAELAELNTAGGFPHDASTPYRTCQHTTRTHNLTVNGCILAGRCRCQQLREIGKHEVYWQRVQNIQIGADWLFKPALAKWADRPHQQWRQGHWEGGTGGTLYRGPWPEEGPKHYHSFDFEVWLTDAVIWVLWRKFCVYCNIV